MNLQQQKIEAYINRQMDGETLKRFEDEIANSPDLEQEVRWQYNILLALQRPDLEQTINKIENSIKPVSPDSSSFWKDRSFLMFVVFFLLVTPLITFLFFNTKILTSDNDNIPEDVFELFDEKFDPTPSTPLQYQPETYEVVSAKETSIEKLVQQVKQYFGNGDFQKALDIINLLEVQSWKPDELYLYKANAYLALNRAEEALAIYDILLESDTNIEDELKWYKGLALLKLQRSKEAKNIFNAIDVNNPFYNAKAKGIISDLEKIK